MVDVVFRAQRDEIYKRRPEEEKRGFCGCAKREGHYAKPHGQKRGTGGEEQVENAAAEVVELIRETSVFHGRRHHDAVELFG